MRWRVVDTRRTAPEFLAFNPTLKSTLDVISSRHIVAISRSLPLAAIGDCQIHLGRAADRCCRFHLCASCKHGLSNSSVHKHDRALEQQSTKIQLLESIVIVSRAVLTPADTDRDGPGGDVTTSTGVKRVT